MKSCSLTVLSALFAGLATTFPSTPALAIIPPTPVDPNATFYVSNNLGTTIEKFDPYGAPLGTFAHSVAHGLAADSAGNIYSSNWNTHLIQEYTPSGGTVVVADQNTVIPGSNGLYPVGMTFDSAGNLFVANAVPNTPGEILKFTTDGQGHYTPSVFASGPAFLAQPFDVAFDSGGNLYVSDFDSNANAIAKFTSQGVGSIFAKSINIYQPSGLVLDGSDNVYVASYNNDLIEEYAPDGTDMGAFAQDDPNSPHFLNGPLGLAFDSVGNLYAANHNSDTIEQFDPYGRKTVFADTNLAGPYFVLIQPNAVPEPPSILLAALGILCFAAWGLRRSWQKLAGPASALR